MPSPAAPSRLLGVLFMGTLLAALDIAIVGPALPALRDALGLDERAVSWVFTAFVLANLAGLPVMAAWADRAGRRTVYLADIALFAAGTLVVVLAPSFEVLLVGRVIQGLGSSGIFPVATAVIGDTFPPESRGRAVGALGAVFGVAFLIGPALGGIMLAVASWRWLFALSIPFAAVVFVLSARTVPDTRADDPKPVDAWGIVLLASLLVSLAVGLSGLDAADLSASLSSSRVWAPLLLSAVLTAAFVAVERRAVAPLVRPGLIARRPVQIACALAIGAGLVEATFVFLSAYAVQAFGVTKAQGSYLLLPLVFGVAIGSPLAGRMLDRIGARPIVTGGCLLVAAGLTVIALGPSLAVHIAGTTLIGFGLAGLLGSSISYILLVEAEAAERTVAQGLSTLALSIGQLTGGALVGAIAASAVAPVVGYRAAFGMIAAVAAVLAIVAQGLRGARPSSRATTA
ncbi:MFS transporter [Rubrivirga sp.]|uniref:MFS transporter n=1 Tax=Rubrivirga sp. TaxID=1885344 RepID=UPI003C772FDF